MLALLPVFVLISGAFAVHACVNAILNKTASTASSPSSPSSSGGSSGGGGSGGGFNGGSGALLAGCTLYTLRFPCLECAKVIAQSGIKEVCASLEEKKCRVWRFLFVCSV
jgi:deoxycytidylate deaminase